MNAYDNEERDVASNDLQSANSCSQVRRIWFVLGLFAC